MEELHKMPGEIKIYNAVDEYCDDHILRRVTLAEKSLALKVEAELMLLYNISSMLTNGARGEVLMRGWSYCTIFSSRNTS